MKDSEPSLPIRHQRDPKAPKLPEPAYKRERPETDLSWMQGPKFSDQASDQSPTMPWLFDPSVNGRSPQPRINWDFVSQVDDAQSDRVYGPWQGEKGLTGPARAHLNTIRYVFGNLIEQLKKTDGNLPDEPLLFGGMTEAEFMKVLQRDVLEDPSNRYAENDYNYLISQMDHGLRQYAKVWNELATPEISRTIDIHHVTAQQESRSRVEALIARSTLRPFSRVIPPSDGQTPAPVSARRHVNGGRTS